MKLQFATAKYLCFLFPALAFGQSPDTAFTLADVHASKPGATEIAAGLLPGGRFEMRGMTLLGLISVAYGLPGDRVLGGPSWLDTDRFDIIAKTDPRTSEATAQAMLQSLLADRFKLVIHKDDKALPVYVLLAGKNPKLKTGSGDAQCSLTTPNGQRTYTCHNMTMSGLVERLPTVAAAYLHDPLIDMTGLNGSYDFTIFWVGRGLISAATGADGDQPVNPSLYDAVDKQLGLKIEPRKQPMPVVVVDSVNRKPTDNPPGITTSIPDVPTEFEVAEIKVSQPGTQQRGDFNGGRLDLFGFTLKTLIMMAYDVEEPMIVGAPKWLDSDRFDVVAKAPHAVADDVAQGMLRKLIEQKFKLTFHHEDQPVPVFALAVGKTAPKVKPADPANRSGCKIGNADGLRIYTCQNTTMAQFTEKLREISQNFLDHPVVDLTGLTGAYDFSVSWAPIARIRAAANKQAAGGAATASVPTGDLTLPEAIDKQLGLKLTAQKHPMPVMVIDHLDRTPIEN